MTLEQKPTHDSWRARAERKRHSGWGWCYRCGFTWKKVEGHTTTYGRYEGCFPLCKDCWTVLETPEARRPYYKMLIDKWVAIGSDISTEEKLLIAVAVAKGL